MLSRVAESIYWMSRQVERAENLARYLEVTINLTLDHPEHLIDPWDPLVQVTGDEATFRSRYGVANENSVVQFLAFDHDYPNSMITCLSLARENARGVREKLSSEAFEQINEFYHFVMDASRQTGFCPTSKFFDDVRKHTLLWNGILYSTMAHDPTWHFANVGRMLERADQTSRILDVKYFNLLPSAEHVGTAIDDLQWSALLLAVSGFEAYLREHHRVEIPKVVEFFLFHRTFPRSVRFCVHSALESMNEIEEASTMERSSEAIKLIEQLNHRVTFTRVEEVLAGGMHGFVDRLQLELNQIANAFREENFQLAVSL